MFRSKEPANRFLLSLSRNQGGSGGLDQIERKRGIGREGREVSHLSSRARGELSVEMQLYVGMREGGLPVGFMRLPDVAEKIRHGGWTQQLS